MDKEKSKYKTEEYVVAFIDILGAKDMIEEDEDGSLNIVHAAYEQAMGMFDDLYDIGMGSIAEYKPKVRIFSDNIVLAVPINQTNRVSACISVVMCAGLLQNVFLGYGKLVRGGIVEGNFFMGDVMIWGNALTEAYRLESTMAFYPRIVVAPKVARVLETLMEIARIKWLKEDYDGMIFVDYLQGNLREKEEESLDFLLIRRIECEELKNQVRNNLKVEQKVNWHTKYVEDKVKPYIEKYGLDEIVKREMALIEKSKNLEIT